MTHKSHNSKRNTAKDKRPNDGKPNLDPSTAALLNILMPKPASQNRRPPQHAFTSNAVTSADGSNKSKSSPKPSSSKQESSDSQRQQMQDLDADERLARQLAEDEEMAAMQSQADRLVRPSPSKRGTQVDYGADEQLARQLAQEEEEQFLSATGQRPAFSQVGAASGGSNTNSPRRSNLSREYNPINYSNIVIHTKSSKKLAKTLAKKHHFNTLTTNNDCDTSDSLSVLRRMRANPEPKYPHVYDALQEAKFVLANCANHKVYLPATSKRRSFADYEEIVVEKMEKTELIAKDKLISIEKNFDAVGQMAFSGCSHLNPMQSIVYETAYKSNKNMLVAAPTGAGKTNVAMMCVLNELRNHFKPNTTELKSATESEKFKIIYIAPMKSLATEQTENFNTRLKKLGIRTRELTGDMSLTEGEMAVTHIIVTTPEKWDVVTRKSKGDVDLLSLVRLMIIDEVHLLQSDRGPVLEALVARTLRYVESSQRMTRIIGLSATLPNYVDVATFLRVNPYEGLFYFDNRFRPVPLTQTFIGVRPLESNSQSKCMDKICYNLALQYASQSKQMMIFVHARNSTQRVANKLREMIQLNNKLELFQPDLTAFSSDLVKQMNSPKNHSLKELFSIGFGVHHAGMIRHDRLLVEKLFRSGVLKVLVCTATLAWGVNFPAHAVVIRGTEIYDASAGKFVDVGLLDVMQIFGRAGRPQYDTEGNAIILTALDKMDSYLKLLTNQTPIESSFTKHLTDNLNAEIVSGTVSTVHEGMEWLRYTYLNVRLAQNPLVYGCEHYEIESDPSIATIRNRLINIAARQLDEAKMCRYDQETGSLDATDLGRIASHFYINYETITRYNEILGDQLEPSDILGLIGEAQEFQQIKFREEEANELDNLRRACRLPIAGGVLENTKGKVSCLLQAYISRSIIQSHSLISDLMYIAQNATRIGRGLFEYALKRRWPMTALNLLKVCKMIELQTWSFNSPFRHFDLPPQVVARLEGSQITIEQLDAMSNAEVAKLVNFPDRMGQTIKEYLKQLPYVIVEGDVQTVKSNLLKLHLTIQPYFKWNKRYHHKRQSFWLWVVDDEITHQIYHSEHLKFTQEQVENQTAQKLTVNIPLVDDTLDDGSVGRRMPGEYIVFVLSNEWSGCDYEFAIDCRKVILPSEDAIFTNLPEDASQLALSALQNDHLARLFRRDIRRSMSTSTSNRCNDLPQSQLYDENDCTLSLMESVGPVIGPQVEKFNIMQSQVFSHIYQSDRNLLICGPAGSGKSLLADLAAMRVLTAKHASTARHKVIYITPLENLAELKIRDWHERLGWGLQKRVSYLYLSNFDKFEQTDIFVSSAARFNIWLATTASNDRLTNVALIIFDDLHLITDDRGCDMECVITTLNRFKSSNSRIRYRIVGISNTVTNAQDLGDWLGVKRNSVFNFDPSTARPIQLETHIMTFSERHYSPRTASMNKPIYKAVLKHSPRDPVMIFVSSKKQCCTTALDLISCLMHYSQSGERPWLHIDHASLNPLLARVHDETLKLSLEFGIGILYRAMKWEDKKLVEELYQYNKIQVLICTTICAWDSDLRARLVVVKGTECYDSKAQCFSGDYPPVDVVQMLGRAGRFNIDATGIAILMIRDTCKDFYSKFLYEPFPAESSLLELDSIRLQSFLMSPYWMRPQTPLNTEPSTQPEDETSGSATAKPPSKKKSGDDKDKKERVSRKKQAAAQLAEARNSALEVLSQTFLAHRVHKNPSYYGVNEKKPDESHLSRFLDNRKYIYSEIRNTGNNEPTDEQARD